VDHRDVVQGLLDRVVARTPLRFEPGYANSGAPLEAVVLDDGTRLVVKRFSPTTDLLMRLTNDRGRAATLWTDGVFDRLPPAIDHAVLAAAPDGDGWVLVMRDVGETILDWERILTRDERRQFLAAMATMHAAFTGERIAGLCSVVDWMMFLSPPVMTTWRGDASGLPDWTLRGWDTFFTAAPHDVADAVAAIHTRPAPLGRELDACEPTLVHGDLCPGNVGLTQDRVVVLDWALATQGPAALDVAAFLATVGWRAGTPPDALLAEVQVAAGEEWDARALELALLATFVAYGWLHADRLLLRDDPAHRDREQPYWEWWIARIRHVLETTWAPAG
jgi:hypothetical protein